MIRALLACVIATAVLGPLIALDLERDLAVATDGAIRIVHPDFPADARNHWADEDEDAFWARVNRFLPTWREAAAKPWQKLESQGHDVAMLAWLAGDRQRAEAWFVMEDSHRADHAHTAGIDLFWGFTLKYRPHWWFLFGHTFPEPYRQRVLEGARLWSASDPRPCLEYTLMLDNPVAAVGAEAERVCALLWRERDAVAAMITAARADAHPNRQAFAAYLAEILPRWPTEMPSTPQGWRDWYALLAAGDWQVYEEYERLVNPRPHPQHGVGSGPVGTVWGPEVRGGIADPRNTDNLRAMREISAYLFAEATGNETTRLVMKEKLRRILVDYYAVGMGEWDSETYHSASTNTWYGLHDHARDAEVRLIAKGVLDYLWTISALKYRGGGWGGPICRDYGDVNGWCGAATSAWIYFGEEELPPRPTASWVNQILSPYRPPQAVLELARRRFATPCEILTSHPAYQTWLPGKIDEPETHATLAYGEHFQVGSRVRGSHYNINGLKTLLDRDDGGVDYLLTAGGTGNICLANAGGDRIAQHRNLILYLNGTDPEAPFRFATSRELPWEASAGVLFIRGDRAWAAIRPIALMLDAEPQRDVAALGLKKGGKTKGMAPLVFTARGDGSGAVRGFAMELGDAASHGDYETFRSRVLSSQELASGQGERPRVDFSGSDGTTVAMRLGADLPEVWRGGELHDWSTHRDLYRPTSGDGPVSLGWKAGVLRVAAGGQVFTGLVDPQTGTYAFSTREAE